MLIPDYSTSIVQGTTILDIKAYLVLRREVTFLIRLSYDDNNAKRKFNFDMDVFPQSWRDRLSDMTSQLSCCSFRKAQFASWEETMYYHFDTIIRRLRLPKYKYGVTFYVDLIQTSKQALERLGLTTSGVGFDNNLLKRITYRDDNDAGDCPICFEGLKKTSGKELTWMPCSHIFHYSCLSLWLPKHETCPMCRYKLNWRTVDEIMSGLI